MIRDAERKTIKRRAMQRITKECDVELVDRDDSAALARSLLFTVITGARPLLAGRRNDRPVKDLGLDEDVTADVHCRRLVERDPVMAGHREEGDLDLDELVRVFL